MKIAIASMAHESNTFNPVKAGFDAFRFIDGKNFADEMHPDTSAAGIYDTLIASGATVIPLFFAYAIPAGTVENEVYEHIKTKITESLLSQGPWDGVCLALHGSMAAEEQDDPEGDLLEAVRKIVGDDIPVTCALDMHATVTRRMVELSDGYSAYRTAPHVDERETGVRAANILLNALNEGKKTINAFVKIPFLVSGEQSETRVDPAKSLFESLKKYDSLLGMLSSSYVMGFPWADSPHGGAGALVTGWDEDREKLEVIVKEMAAKFWAKRADFTFSTQAMRAEQAIETALAAKEFPVIISDSADNPTAGASQDTTRFLQQMIESKMKNAVYTCVADPEAYKTCASHSIGDEFAITVGGCFSKKENERFMLTAKLIILAESENTSYAVMQKNGVTFTISNKRCATYKPDTLRDFGLEPKSFDIIGIKAGYLSPEYQKISKLSILALTEGDTALELKNLPYIKTPRPIYPLDPEMVFNITS